MFFLAWLPWAEISLAVEQEPLSLDFDLNIRSDFGKVLPELSIIPSYYLDSQDLSDKTSSYFLIDDLRNLEEGKVLAFRREDVKKVVDFKAKLILDEFISQEEGQADEITKEVFWPVLTEENFDILTQDLNIERAKLRVTLKGEVVTNYDWSLLRKKIVGQSLREARLLLEEVKGINKAKIENWPSFYSRLPLFYSRIKIKIEDYERLRSKELNRDEEQ
ncbi:hypothetical protein K9K85_02085 [Patescibacteria group bacterium]|nr:hypothetical protein [Patescibacteria group bacterium]